MVQVHNFLVKDHTNFRWFSGIPLAIPLFIALILTTCQEPAPARPEPYPNTSLALEAIQVNCIDVQLKFSLLDMDSVTTDTIPVILKRDGQIVMAIDFVPPDTILWDSGREPNQNYTYIAYRQSVYNSSLVDSSNSISITTMDTTSHDFTWEVDTIGDWGSYFKDVTIINENNVWAVGDIKPSYEQRYNLAKWNGDTWSYSLFGRVGVIGRGIFAFSENNVWITTGIIYHYINGKWERYHLWDMGVLDLSDGSINKVWGAASDDVYFVGDKGTVVHYNGSEFTKLVSNTDIKLTDVWGVQDNNGEVHVWACGSGDHDESIVLKITDQTVETIYERYVGGANSLDDETIMSPMGETLWATPSSTLLWVAGGFGIFTLDNNQSPQRYSEVIIPTRDSWHPYTWKMRGTDKNDLFLAGEYGAAYHFNGKNWRWYSELRNDGFRLWCMATSPHLVVMGGEDNSAFLRKGIIAIGRR